MRRSPGLQMFVVILLGLVLPATIGCGNSAGDKDGLANSQPATTAAELTGPSQTVHTFLEGMRRGDDETVKAMFTEEARRELARTGRNVSPKASDSVRFEVGQIQISPEDENVAYVTSHLTELNAGANQSRSEKVIWALRNTSEGWRIAGMARFVEPEKPPIVVDFENMAPAVAEQSGTGSRPSDPPQRAPATALSPDPATLR